MNAYALPTRALDYYRADLDTIPPLTREAQLVNQLPLFLAREQALPAHLVTQARHRLVEGNQRLILFLARQHYRRFKRLDLEDLIQEGSLALLEATERCAFSHEHFSGYASSVIRGAFTTAWTQDWPVSITRDILLDLNRGDHIRGNPLLAADSLDARLAGSEDLTLADVLDASSTSSAWPAADPQKTMLLERLLGGLSARQRQVVRLRYGLDEADQREWSLREIAEQLHTSENGVRSILTHALATCRRLAEKQGAASRPQPQRQRPRPPTEPLCSERMAQKQRERLAKLQEAEQLLRERGERITGKRLAELAHVDNRVARAYARTHRDPAYEAMLHQHAQQHLAEACAQLEEQGQPVTLQRLVHLAPVSAREASAFLNARAGNAQERLTRAYAQVQAHGWKKLGSRRLAQAAQVSEQRAVLLLRAQAARQARACEGHQPMSKGDA